MSTTTEHNVAQIVEQFQQFETQLQEKTNPVLHQIRKNAIEAFQKSGFPAKKHEEYRYIDLDTIKEATFTLPKGTNTEDLPVDEFKIPNLESNVLVFIDGVYSEQHSERIDDNVQISSINDAPIEILEAEFKNYGYADYNPFATLNIAFANEGAFIHIPKGKVVEHPIQIISINTGVNFVQPHHLLLAEENAQVKVIENYFSLTDEGIDNTFFKIIAKPSSIVEHYKMQVIGEDANHFGTTFIKQYSKSVCTTHVYNLGGGLVRNNVRIDIEDEHTEANMYGLYMLDDQDVADNHTLVNHKKSNCVSNQLYKGIMNGQSRAVFNGKIFVQRNAQNTNAFQSNNNIVLSDDASINTKPQLEIWADDVRCSHGATIGKLSPDEIFYLKARGIKEEKAKAMLTYAFAGEVLTYITIPQFRAFLQEGVAQKLGFEI